MTNKERKFIAGILVMIIAIMVTDLTSDFREGTSYLHLLAEGLVAFAAVVGIFFLMRGSFTLKHSLEEERQNLTQLKADAEKWRSESRKYIDGLSKAIDAQLSEWNLSASEKEVAFLLLKGMSSKEIADIRKTAEKTARAQSVAIYSKSGLSGRSELAAFFLEDLLPAQMTNKKGIIDGKNI